MKKLALLSAVLLVTFACQKEEINGRRIPLNSHEVIVGKWKVKNIELYEDRHFVGTHNVNQTLEFKSDSTLIVTGEGIGGTTLTDTISYTYLVDSENYFLRIEEESRIYQGCMVYLRQEFGEWILGFTRPTGNNTKILWQYHCIKQ